MKEDEMYEILQKKALKVEVPESLEPSEIEKQCRQVNQKKSHKKWYGMGAVAAAVLLCPGVCRKRTVCREQEPGGKGEDSIS